MADALTEMLAEREWILLDGATGTNLFEMGLSSGASPELWNVDHPERVRALHDGFIAAGSDLILTNSFGGTACRLRLHGGQDRVHELNRRAAEIARAAADAAGRGVIVAGSVGPTGELLEPLGELSEAAATDFFAEQIEGLMAGGADVIWIETIYSEEEYRAAAAAAIRCGAPYCATLSFDTAGRTMMGITSKMWPEIADRAVPPPIAIGANCGTGASDLMRTVMGIVEADPDRVVIAKGNAGIPKFVDGRIVYDGTPELMADYARLARDAGVRMIGGCCGSRAEHVRAMRAALETHVPGGPPSMEAIRARLGEFSSRTDGTEPEEAASPGRRKRRPRA